MPDKLLAVVSVQGRDQKGVVAQFATFIADRGINIEDLEQRVVSGLFVMDMLVDLKEMSVSLDELITGALALGKAIGMEVKVTLQRQPRSKRIVLLASKEKHCLEKLLASPLRPPGTQRPGRRDPRQPCGPATPLAAKAAVPFEQMSSDDKPAHMTWLLARLRELKPDIIVLARYMQILAPEIVNAFPSRIINIHPSLLPFFPGASPYRQAYESGARVTGCTAHFVTEQLDQGPIILQDVFHINVGTDTAEVVREHATSRSRPTSRRKQ